MESQRNLIVVLLVVIGIVAAIAVFWQIEQRRMANAKSEFSTPAQDSAPLQNDSINSPVR